jgi:hypothetical protein
VEVESSTSDSSEDEDEGSLVEIGDMALFMKTYKKRVEEARLQVCKEKVSQQEKENLLQLWEHRALHCGLPK